MAPVLHIRLLGAFQLTCDQQPLPTINSARLQALLAYLVLHAAAPQPRQYLAFLLWPDSTEAQARTNLRKLCFQLRQALPAPDAFLQMNNHTLQWKTDAPYTLDVRELDRLLHQVEQNPLGRDGLTRIVELYTGDLLPGCYDDWIALLRQKYRHGFQQTLEHLVMLLENQRAYEEGVRYAQRLLQLDPLDETSYQRLMRLHALKGDRAGALRTYQECVKMLRQELSVEPSEETQQVYEWILRKKSAPVTHTAPTAMLLHTASAQPHQQRQSLTVHASLPRAAGSLPRHNLPIQLTPFIGRAQQIPQLVEQLKTHCLLTLTGAGGVGKTRLALEVAARLLASFGDGVWFVDLAPLTDSSVLPQRILDLWRVPEQPESVPLATLIAYLSAKHTLLILDNCEHLIGTCATLAETLLQHCPQLSLLATSREVLNIRDELAWRVPSLTRPQTNAAWEPAASAHTLLAPATLVQFEAVTLFIERVRRHQSSFALTTVNAPAVAQICRRLDGIPLALEMAAARVNVFTVEELATRLDGAFDARFQLLTSGTRTAPSRQQTLRATLEWSYTLLIPTEQRLLTHLSVFSGGWTAAALEQVVGATLDLLAQLVNKSLVIADQQAGRTRYRLLETVRQFAAEQLMPDEEVQRQVQRQHSRYYLRLLGEQEARLQGQQQQGALAIIHSDFANISAAWHWAVERHEFALLAPAVHALFLFCDVLGRYRTGITLFAQAASELQAALTDCTPAPPTLLALGGQVLARLGACAIMVSDFIQGEQHLQASLRLATKDQERALALVHLGVAAAERGELALAVTYLEESLASSQRGNDLAGMADALRHLQLTVTADYPYACRLCTESLTLWRNVGRPDRIANVTTFLAYFTCCAGDYPTANTYWREALALCDQLELLNEKAWVLHCMGYGAWCQGELVVAEQLLREALSLYTEFGRQSMLGTCLAELALVLTDSGQVEQALISAREAVTITRAVNSQMMLINSLNCLGAALLAAGDLDQARQTLCAAIAQAWEHQYVYHMMAAFYYFAMLLVRESAAHAAPAALANKALAVTLLSCIRTQPATHQIFKDKAAHQQVELEDALPDVIRTAAIARGQNSTMEQMVGSLLCEGGTERWQIT